MEIRTRSKTGPLVVPLDNIPAELAHQVDARKRQWRDQLARDPASFARIEVEIHDHFRNLADQMTASLLAEATTPDDQAGPEKKGAPARPTDHGVPRSRGGGSSASWVAWSSGSPRSTAAPSPAPHGVGAAKAPGLIPSGRPWASVRGRPRRGKARWDA